jgi:DNA-binding LacI/PurR family transcriptional regulator
MLISIVFMNERPRTTPEKDEIAVNIESEPLPIEDVKQQTGAKPSDGKHEAISDLSKKVSYSAGDLLTHAQKRETLPLTYLNIHGFLGLGDEFIAETIGGLLEGCNLEDKDLNLQRMLTVERYKEKLNTKEVAGIVLHAYHDHPIVGMLCESGLPVVAICDAIPDFPSVVVDDEAGGRMIAHYLSDRGYRRVLYRRFTHELTTSRRRYEGFMDVAVSRRLEVTVAEVDNDYILGADEIDYLNNAHNHPCVVTGWRDLSLMAVAKFCRESGLRVPEDVALAGFDGMSMVPQVSGVLTTIVAPWSQVAKKSIMVLSALIDQREVPDEVVLPVRLRIGDTT